MITDDWRHEFQHGRYRRAASLLEQMNDCDDVDCLQALGVLYFFGMHLFESEAEYMRFMRSAAEEQQRAFWEAAEEYCLRGVVLLERAVEKGNWSAAQILSTYYTTEVKGLAEEDRRSKAVYYYALEEKLRPAQL